MRVFFCSYRAFNGLAGGSAGVNYKLYLANKKYNLFDISIHVFKNCVVTEKSDIPALDINNNSNWKNGIKRVLLHFGIIDVVAHKFKLKNSDRWIKRVGNEFKFNSDDMFFFHDVESFDAFSHNYPLERKVLIYHQQGSLYDEWASMHGIRSTIYKRYLDRYLNKVLSQAEYLSFPSLGARDILFSSDACKSFDKKKTCEVMYNGVDVDDDLDGCIRQDRNEKVFITVAQVNYAKGVDRIPAFLSELKKNNIRIKWIIIGDGNYSDALAKNIHKYNLESEVEWHKDWLDHKSVMEYMGKSDFFIEFQRTPIFDFAILEAMSLSVVPILSNLGGNKEIVEDLVSGVLIDDFNDISKIIPLLQKDTFCYVADNAKRRQMEKFSEYAFLTRYKELADTITNDCGE